MAENGISCGRDSDEIRDVFLGATPNAGSAWGVYGCRRIVAEAGIRLYAMAAMVASRLRIDNAS